MKKIALIYEGGIGDCLLAHRLTPAIFDKHKDCELDVYFNTDGNPYQAQVIEKLFPGYYNKLVTLPKRVSSEYKITTRFGEENYPAHVLNIPAEAYVELEQYAHLYNFHIDGMNWVRSGLNWQKYFVNFERPNYEYPVIEGLPNSPFVMAHLFARPDTDRKLEDWYVTKLLKEISKKYPVVSVVESKYLDYYKDKIGENSFVFSTDMRETMGIAQNCAVFIGLDSSIRYLPMFWNKPSFVFNKFCPEYGQVPPHQLIRWALNEKWVFPMHFDVNKVVKTLDDSIKLPYGQLFGYNPNKLEDITVDRFYGT